MNASEAGHAPDGETRVPELKVGDEIGSYHVVELSEARLVLGTSYGLLLFFLIAGIAMLVFDWWIFQQRVLSHVLLAMNGTTALAFKGAMIVLPVFGLPFVLYSRGRSIVIDAQAGVVERRWLFVFGKKVPISEVARVEMVFTPPVSEASDTSAQLKLVDSKGEALIEFPSVYAERQDVLSRAASDFGRMVAMTRSLEVLTRREARASGDLSALSDVNRQRLERSVANAAHKDHASEARPLPLN